MYFLFCTNVQQIEYTSVKFIVFARIITFQKCLIITQYQQKFFQPNFKLHKLTHISLYTGKLFVVKALECSAMQT